MVVWVGEWTRELGGEEGGEECMVEWGGRKLGMRERERERWRGDKVGVEGRKGRLQSV